MPGKALGSVIEEFRETLGVTSLGAFETTILTTLNPKSGEAQAVRAVKADGTLLRSGWLKKIKDTPVNDPAAHVILAGLYNLLQQPKTKRALMASTQVLGSLTPEEHYRQSLRNIEFSVIGSEQLYAPAYVDRAPFDLLTWLRYPREGGRAFGQEIRTCMYEWFLDSMNGDFSKYAAAHALWSSTKYISAYEDIRAYMAYHLGLVSISYAAYGEAIDIANDLENFVSAREEFSRVVSFGENYDYSMPGIYSLKSLKADALRLRATARGLAVLKNASKANKSFTDLFSYLDKNQDMPDWNLQQIKAERELLRFAARIALRQAYKDNIGILHEVLPKEIGGRVIRDVATRFTSRLITFKEREMQRTLAPLDFDTGSRISLVLGWDGMADMFSTEAYDLYEELSQYESIDKRCNSLVKMGLYTTRIFYLAKTIRLDEAKECWHSLQALVTDQSRAMHSRKMMEILMRFGLDERSRS